MKKLSSLALLLLLSAALWAQKKGKEEILSWKTEDGTNFTVGDTLHFGMGSNTNGDFRYVYTLPTFFNSNYLYYNSSLNGKFATIDKMQKSGNAKMGYTMYFTFRYGMGSSAVNVESAITSGEMITPASKRKMDEKEKPVIIQQGGASSVADELKKLKELLDSGVLTQEEYGAQKQKLLGK
jgi:hypothetical protein